MAKRAEELLARREPIGWKLGLERMRRLCSLLGMPQNRFASVHVVGTNGKTSVTRMTAALIEAHGVPTGAYVSPHISSWRERILIGGEPISEEEFVGVLERTEQAAEAADRSAGEEEGPVTQFELVTAAAFLAFAQARIKVGVIEAGLGGRLDATNVIPSKVTVLTSVGLDHTEWLGETLEEIAAEKLAVLRDHTTLVHGGLPPEVNPVVERAVADKHAVVVRPDRDLGSGFQGRNLSVAAAATEAVLGRLDEKQLFGAISSESIPGRGERVAGDPTVIFDAAHNPDGARALAETLPQLAEGREVVCCIAVLAEKDAGAMIEALSGQVASFVCTQIPEDAIRGSGRPIGTSYSASELAELCAKAGVMAEAVSEPLDAWEHAKALARERGGVALAAGSHYLLSCLWTERHAASS